MARFVAKVKAFKTARFFNVMWYGKIMINRFILHKKFEKCYRITGAKNTRKNELPYLYLANR